MKELEKYDLPTEIKKMADTIYQRIDEVRRGDNRKQLILLIVYKAYGLLGQTVDPEKLSEQFGFNKGILKRSDSKYCMLFKKILPTAKSASIEDYVELYAKKAEMSPESSSDARAWAAKLVQACPTLVDESRQTISIGILKMYMDVNGIIPESGLLESISNRTTPTITAITERLHRLDNRL